VKQGLPVSGPLFQPCALVPRLRRSDDYPRAASVMPTPFQPLERRGDLLADLGPVERAG